MEKKMNEKQQPKEKSKRKFVRMKKPDNGAKMVNCIVEVDPLKSKGTLKRTSAAYRKT
jgi:hypothetical protein